MTPGTKLGPYEIISPIGAGGMGEVYKARDTRLDRIVAIKVSKEQFSERFEREARAIAALNHPHICQLYDVGPNYLVMEFIEGGRLTAPLPFNEALRVAGQICEALDAAHRKKITHRDLKPANVMITKQGQVKLLDFGLAKFAPAAVEKDATVSLPLTGAGMVMGTVPYMAPEQVEGKEVDSRTDIFAFGTVLYELVTGKRAFRGDSQASLIGAIMHQEVAAIEPEWLDRVLRRCLAKDPEERWQSARDLRESLVAPIGAETRRSSALLWIGLAGALAVALAAFALLDFRGVAAERHLVKLAMLPPDGASFGEIAVSPDGRRVAFTSAGPGASRLWVRPLDSLAAQPLVGTEDASFPFWSPDSRFIGFFAQGKLKKIDVSGGPPQTIAGGILYARGGAWSKDGVILFSPGTNSRLLRVSSSGGEARPATYEDSPDQRSSHRLPAFLPDGRHFLYLRLDPNPSAAGIYLGSLDSRQDIRLVGDESKPVYVPSPSGNGFVLFSRGGVLMAQSFDLAKHQVSGDLFPVAESVDRYGYSVSEGGTLTYKLAAAEKTNQLTWFDRKGQRLGTAGEAGVHYQPWLSPDEKQVAIDRANTQARGTDIWLIDLARGVSNRFTFDTKAEWWPVWSPDGRRIIFSADRDGGTDLYQKAANGGGAEELVLKSPNGKYATDWSMDGRFVLYNELDSKTKLDLWILPLLSGDKPIPYLRTEFAEENGVMSPGGNWIAYDSDESGRFEVYVQPFPATGAKWQLSKDGGRIPKWRRDGGELYYLGADKKLMAVEVKAGVTFQSGIPRSLFETRINHPIMHYAVTRDGQRFLIPHEGEDAVRMQAVVVLNWMEALKQRAGPK